MSPDFKLVFIKGIHTLAWAFFASCIVAIPIAANFGAFSLAAIFFVAVIIEIIILIANKGACPLTAIAARYTSNRKPNFDIYLPERLAEYNKQLFGTLFIAGSLYALILWMGL